MATATTGDTGANGFEAELQAAMAGGYVAHLTGQTYTVTSPIVINVTSTIQGPLGKTKSGRDPCEPREGDTPPVARWRARMASQQGKDVYKRRSVCELVHAKLCNRGIDRLYVRGRDKVETWMRWFALAANILTAHRLANA
jgi:hypothetical protein